MFLKIHVVNSGETLHAIGRLYGIAPGLIARYNGLREPYRLAVGQSLLILRPLLTYTVRPGDSLYAIGQRFGVSVRELWQNNPNLSGGTHIYPGQVLVIRLEAARTRPLAVSGYAYPFVRVPTLRGILPDASYLAPFTYGITAEGGLVPLDDGALLALAREYGAEPLLHLSTLTEDSGFSARRAAQVLLDPEKAEALIEQTAAVMTEKGYRGVDVDFEYLGAELSEAYADFVGALRQSVRRRGGFVIAALAPKTSAEQRGALYEGHDYRKLAAAADFVLVMAYEWGYTYGPPMAVAPLDAVRRVIGYAVREMPPEKIFMGFPNYAYDWTLPYRAGASRAELLGNEAAAELAVRVGAEIAYDETAQTPHFRYTGADGAAHEVWFEDARSCAAKCELLEQYGLHGLGVWNFMRPFTAAFSLLHARFELCTPVDKAVNRV